MVFWYSFYIYKIKARGFNNLHQIIKRLSCNQTKMNLTLVPEFMPLGTMQQHSPTTEIPAFVHLCKKYSHSPSKPLAIYVMAIYMFKKISPLLHMHVFHIQSPNFRLTFYTFNGTKYYFWNFWKMLLIIAEHTCVGRK